MRRRSLIAPASFHLIPESITAIVTSGRPSVVSQAVEGASVASATCAPRIPCSSTGLLLMAALDGPASVAANFQSLSSPARSPGVSLPRKRSLKSSGSPLVPVYGKAPNAGAATKSARTATAIASVSTRPAPAMGLPFTRRFIGPAGYP